MKKETFVDLFNKTKEFYDKLTSAYSILNMTFENDAIVSYVDSVLEAMIVDLEQVPDETNAIPLILYYMFDMDCGKITKSTTVIIDKKEEVVEINSPEELYDIIKKGAVKFYEN
jgi:hypothetical protein